VRTQGHAAYMTNLSRTCAVIVPQAGTFCYRSPIRLKANRAQEKAVTMRNFDADATIRGSLDIRILVANPAGF
jgi:hypothetical protein